VPLYEYQCTKCGEQFEVRQTMGADGSKLNCPRCQAGNPARLMSTFSSAGSEGSFGSGDSCSPFTGGT